MLGMILRITSAGLSALVWGCKVCTPISIINSVFRVCEPWPSTHWDNNQAVPFFCMEMVLVG